MTKEPREYVMKVDIRARNLNLDGTARAYTVRRLAFALGRFGARIRGVTVRFEDTNGARGGTDKLCRVDIGLRPSGRLLVEDVDAELFLAIDRAADRAGRSVARLLERNRALKLFCEEPPRRGRPR